MKQCCNNKKCNSQIKTEVTCKATAALDEQVKEELKEQDKPIGEIIDNAQDTQ